MLNWRSSQRPWALNASVLAVPAASFHGYDTGATDGEGRPVLYFRQTKMVRSLIDKGAFEQAAMFFVERAGSVHDEFVVLYDCADFSVMQNFSIAPLASMFNILQQRYPETLYAAYILPDRPFCFSAAYKLVVPFIQPFTASKIYFLDASTANAVLAEKIGSDGLPPFLGGTSVLKDMSP
jgi:hypothetical protein